MTKTAEEKFERWWRGEVVTGTVDAPWMKELAWRAWCAAPSENAGVRSKEERRIGMEVREVPGRFVMDEDL